MPNVKSKATNKNKISKKYEGFPLRLSPELKARMTEHVKEKGESANYFIIRAVTETLERETSPTIEDISGKESIDLAALLQGTRLSFKGVDLSGSDLAKLSSLLEEMVKPRLETENIFAIKNSSMGERRATAKSLLDEHNLAALFENDV